MTIRLELPDLTKELKPRITVFGVGGAGGNAVKNMIGAGLEGVEFVVANTDAQALGQNTAERKIQMGVSVTQGLGAGSHPQIGRAAAEEAMPEILENLHGSHMVFVTAGMGGGTGTGASPMIAAAAREQGILTIGVVTKPFHFEGTRRMRIAEEGVAELQQHVDTLLVIPNQNLFRIANEQTAFVDAFAMADRVLHSGVASITDLMVKPGLINLDFADVRAVMDEMGKAMMGTGEAAGEKRSLEAAQAAISNPLLDDVSMKGARGVLINITGGTDMTLFEVDEAANHIRSEVDADCNIIIGSTFDAALEGVMRVAVVATGIGGDPRPSQEEHPGAREDSVSSVIPLHPAAAARNRAERIGARLPASQAGGEAQMRDASAQNGKNGMRVVAPMRKPISLDDMERKTSQPPVRPAFGADASHNSVSVVESVSDACPSPRSNAGGAIAVICDDDLENVTRAHMASVSVAAGKAPAEETAGRRSLLRRIGNFCFGGGKSAAARSSNGRLFGAGGSIGIGNDGGAEAQASRIPYPSPADASAPMEQSADASNLDDVDMGIEEDQLEIPAFMRRRAN